MLSFSLASEEKIRTSKFKENIIETPWFLILSVSLWVNLITTPLLMLWPHYNEDWLTLLWLNEAIWLLEIARRLLFSAKDDEDSYEVALNYIRSSLLLDVIATLPQIASFLDVKFTFLKIVRIHMITKLHYPFDLCLSKYLKESYTMLTLQYAIATILYILVLLHYLGCTWIFVGSDYFVDYEEGYLPWTLANDDFANMTNLQMLVFSNYWICTVITTVGYGDYAGGSTLEYQFTTAVEFLGFVLFAMLQIAVLQFVTLKNRNFGSFLTNIEMEALAWFNRLERASGAGSLPRGLYESMKDRITWSFRNDHTIILNEYDFFRVLPPKMQNELIEYLFGQEFRGKFQHIFEGCERTFVNRVIVNLIYKSYNHGEVI